MQSNFDRLMEHAYFVAQESPDPSTQNGALIVGPDLIGGKAALLGKGFNGFPPGVDARYWNGAKKDKYLRVVHAEMAAILSVAQSRVSIMGATMVCPWAACSSCAKHIAASGIHRLVRHSYANNGADPDSHWFKDCELGDEILEASGVEVVEIPPIQTNVKLLRNGHLWPKDEE